MRFGLERMRRLLTALGSPAGALPRRPRRRHQRQVLDRALHRRAARGARRAHRRVPLAAPDDVRRAHPDRRRRPRAATTSAPRSQRAAAAAAKVDRTLDRRRARHPVRAADRGRVRRARPARGRGRGGRGGPRRALGRDQRARRRRSWCSPTSGSSTRAGSARRSRDIAGEKLAVVRAGATLVLGDDAARGGRAGARPTGATIVRARADRGRPARATSARNFAAARAAAEAHPRPLDEARVAPPPASSVSRAPAGRRPATR